MDANAKADVDSVADRAIQRLAELPSFFTEMQDGYGGLGLVVDFQNVRELLSLLRNELREATAFAVAAPLVQAVYARHGTGCCARSVLEDQKVDGGSVAFCLSQARERGHADCVALGEAMREMLPAQRLKLCAIREAREEAPGPRRLVGVWSSDELRQKLIAYDAYMGCPLDTYGGREIWLWLTTGQAEVNPIEENKAWSAEVLALQDQKRGESG